MHLKIRRRNGVESLTTLEEGEFKLAIDGCINLSIIDRIRIQQANKWIKRSQLGAFCP